MSCVTDLVFILPNLPGDARVQNQMRFENSFQEAHGWAPEPSQDGGGKVMSTTVYAAGVNWIRHEWIDSVVAANWPAGTVLWLQHEGVMDQPDVIVVHQLGPQETDRG